MVDDMALNHSTITMLEFPRNKWQIEVRTNAITVAVGAMLLQSGPEDKPDIIEHFSKVLAKAHHKVKNALVLWDALHRPQQPAFPHVEQITTSTDAALVVKSQ